MPRMKGAAVQCCMCLTGVFMFLGGVIMLATGITLILNYGFFDEEFLPPDLQTEEGKRTIGIILTCCGVLATMVSVFVSVLYFCVQEKSHSINPNDLSRIPSTAPYATPDSAIRRMDRSERRQSAGKSNYVSNGSARTQHVKQIPGSTEVKRPRQQYKKARHRKTGRHVRRLEEIKEQDAVSRKTVEGALVNSGYENDTPRSGSFSSEMTIEDQTRLPRVTFNDYDSYSASSASTSQTSDISTYRNIENDKSRREVQFIPESMRFKDMSETMSKDSASLEHYDETSLIDHRNADEFSITSDNLRNPILNSSTTSPNSDNTGNNSAGGISYDDYSVAQPFSLPEVVDSDGSIVSYKASHSTELHGEQTTGRISPQVGEVESFTQVEALNQKVESFTQVEALNQKVESFTQVEALNQSIDPS